jgi:hypothetical protein
MGNYFMVGQILKELVEKKARLAPWMEEGIWNLPDKLEPMVCYGFQAQKMCSHCQVETIRVVMALLKFLVFQIGNYIFKNQIKGVGKKTFYHFGQVNYNMSNVIAVDFLTTKIRTIWLVILIDEY